MRTTALKVVRQVDDLVARRQHGRGGEVDDGQAARAGGHGGVPGGQLGGQVQAVYSSVKALTVVIPKRAVRRLASHPDVAECAVVGVGDELKGQVPLGFLVLKAGVTRPDAEIVAEVVRLVREKIGKLRELSPLWEMYQDGIDLSTVQWAAH